ncbi:MAG: exonuclease domain-containing protein [Bacteroidota bacterium]
MFAIVDIETTGGNAQYGGITEIAIVLHNGNSTEGRYETLINPKQHIPNYITALTGISNYTVADAPCFEEVADKIYNLLNGRVFVAHNVNFDYSFIHHHLLQCGFNWQAKKLCTVRYARKVVPGKPSYSLGNITRELNIGIENRHRAGGDATATVSLLEQLMLADEGSKHLQELLKGKNPHSYLPMNVPEEQINNLPYCPGVYYFHDRSGKVIYVGKAKNIKFRVRSHFANNNPNQRKQEFIRNIYSITYQSCATEFMAIVLEALEIKKRWPLYNRSQKRFEQMYGLYTYEDQTGLMRLVIEKKRKHLPALHCFNRKEEGFSIGRKLMSMFDMQEQMVFATANNFVSDANTVASHNIKMKAAIHHLKNNLPGFAIVQKGIDEKGRAVQVGFLIDRGMFAGMGYVDENCLSSFENFKDAMTVYHDYDFVRAALHHHAERYPAEVVRW